MTEDSAFIVKWEKGSKNLTSGCYSSLICLNIPHHAAIWNDKFNDYFSTLDFSKQEICGRSNIVTSRDVIKMYWDNLRI